MESARWDQVQTLFHQAADLPPLERTAFLQARCAQDPSLLSDVRALLEHDIAGASVLDRELPAIADQLLDGSQTRLPFEDFGPYRILKLLGEGGMGVVYLARREDLDSLVAIKFLRDAWMSPARRERFSNEQRTLAQLNHPFIARLYDAGILADGTPWFVMEYVDGDPLTQHCAAHQCTLNQRLQIFRSVCEAVQFAHASAILHRDLKPSNILVSREGIVKLLDFGISKHLETSEAENKTRTGFRPMTPAYAAPEQIRNETVGLYTDVYALGVILYELLAGQLPFDLSQRTPGEAELLIVHHEPAKPSTLAKSSSIAKSAWSDLDVLCLTAMHKDPLRRYRSTEALIRDIDHYLHNEPLEARPDSLRYRIAKFTKRNRRPLLATAAVLLTVIGLVTFYTIRLAKARDTAVAEAQRTKRIQDFMESLFQGDDDVAGPSEDMKVVTLLDRGIKKAQHLDDDPETQTGLFITLGSLFETMGKFDQAGSLLKSSLAKRKAHFGPDSPQVAESLIALGLLEDDQAHYADAERLVQEGLAIDQRHLAPDHPAIASAMETLGRLMNRRGAYREAIPLLEQAMRIQSSPGKSPKDLAITLSDLANAKFYIGQYRESEILNRKLLAADQQTYGVNHPSLEPDLINLALLDQQMERYSEAEQFERRALQIDRSWRGMDHPETVSAAEILADTLVYEGKYKEAQDLATTALASAEKIYGKVHPRVAAALNVLGRIALAHGNLDGAESDFTRAVDIYRAVHHDRHYHIAVAISHLGEVQMARKHYAQAEQFYRDALRRYIDTQSADHLYTGIARIRLGQALLAEHRKAEAKQQLAAGYAILMKQAEPPPKWVRTAKEELRASN